MKNDAVMYCIEQHVSDTGQWESVPAGEFDDRSAADAAMAELAALPEWDASRLRVAFRLRDMDQE